MPVELNSSIYKSPEDAKIAEVKMEKYINEDKTLVEKANRPLHIW